MLDIHQRTLNQVGRRLKQLFHGHIDMSDVKGGNDGDPTHFLSRALAALYVRRVSGLPIEQVGQFVTDGGEDGSGDDGGIDAIYFHPSLQTLFLVQSKWRNNPSKGFALTEWKRFRDGVQQVLSVDFSGFNAKTLKLKPQIDVALNGFETKIQCVILNASHAKLSAPVTKDTEKFIKAQNQYTDDFVSVDFLDLRRINDLARAVSRTPKIDVEIALRQWGEITTPYGALYGTAGGSELADLFASHKENLLRENLRYVLDKSSVNAAISETLKSTASSFWYYNNGITAICEKYVKKPLGGPDKDVGSFRIEGISVVNGAQTIGALGRAKGAGTDLSETRVLFRVISLEGTPDGFAKSVTTANNTQNEVQLMDFAALDERQAELAVELRKLGLTYSYRRGEPEPAQASGFDLRAATVALACASTDLRLAVQAKRYISGLWEDPSREPYTTIFPEALSAAFVWNAVRITRLVDTTLTKASESLSGKDRLIAVHGNRFILHCIFQSIDQSKLTSTNSLDQQMEKDIVAKTQSTLVQTRTFIQEHYPDSYPGNLFKNQDRQLEMMQSFQAMPSPDSKGQGLLL